MNGMHNMNSMDGMNNMTGMNHNLMGSNQIQPRGVPTNGADYYGIGSGMDMSAVDTSNQNLRRVNNSPHTACRSQDIRNCLSASNDFMSIMPMNTQQPTMINSQNYQLVRDRQDLQGITSIEGNALEYLNGFLRSQIGKYVVVDFYLGASSTIQKEGYLIGVGSNYIVLNDIKDNNVIAADFYQIKFVTFTLIGGVQSIKDSNNN